MSFSTSATRKARRKEEREQKKQKKRGNNTNKSTAAVAVEGTNKAGAEEDSKKRQAVSHPDRSLGKKAKRTTSTSTSTTTVISHSPSSRSRDPYARLPPEVAAAMRRDDEEIADLEMKLGMRNGSRAGDRLNSEYAKNECFGEDFGNFLNSLDDLCKQILTSPPQEFSEDEQSCSSQDTSESESIEKSTNE